MLPPALLRAADHLIDALMQVADAVAAFGNDRTSPAEPAQAARTLLHRLTFLIVRLVRLSNASLPTPRQSGLGTPDPIAPASPARHVGSSSMLGLPRRPGWLLDILPDDASALTAALCAALADPALGPLLDAAPTLARALRPVLNALGLDAPSAPRPGPPAPLPEFPVTPLPHPSAAHPMAIPASSRPVPLRPLTSISLRFSN